MKVHSDAERLGKVKKLLALAADPAASANEKELATVAAQLILEPVTSVAKPKTPKRKTRGQNEGSIYKGSDGRWRAIVPSRHSKTGKRRIIYGSVRLGTNTREAVANQLNAYLTGQPGPVVKPAQHTVETYLKGWLEGLKLVGDLRPKTIESYGYTVSLIVPIIGSVKLQVLDDTHVRHLMATLKTNGKADRTVRYARSVLSVALAPAARRQGKRPPLIARNPASVEALGITRSERKKDRRRKIEPIDAGSITAMLAKVVDPADRLLLETVATFGLRIGEALGLKWGKINFEERSIHIDEAAQRQPKLGDEKSRMVLVEVKTPNSIRSLLVNDPLLEKLRAYRLDLTERRRIAGDLWQDHDLVFPSAVGTPQDSRNVLRILHRAQKAAGVKTTSLHRLRHSAATYMLNRGIPLDTISAMLGHSSTAITREFYAAFELAQQRQAAKEMENAFTPKEPAAKKRRRKR